MVQCKQFLWCFQCGLVAEFNTAYGKMHTVFVLTQNDPLPVFHIHQPPVLERRFSKHLAKLQHTTAQLIAVLIVIQEYKWEARNKECTKAWKTTHRLQKRYENTEHEVYTGMENMEERTKTRKQDKRLH